MEKIKQLAKVFSQYNPKISIIRRIVAGYCMYSKGNGRKEHWGYFIAP